MSTTNTFRKRFNFFRNLWPNRNKINLSNNDLVNSRVGMDPTDENGFKKQSNLLQVLMYSKENDTLFI
ncbi:hypothetical protein [Flavobacterium acetivorans]|uniref:hypothetical protein n=1 Tax=Flavobacterium acetivorans TaxID=2893883 RepID=UPI001E3B7C98|nr:hypothetical protein [Flavobacterium sp. F-29]UFH35932.1 hypothetical protein LNP19_02560 [Flavobacterium sp. F-29]